MKNDLLLFSRVAWQIARKLLEQTRGKSLLITSARSGEGKTFFAGALAAALNQQSGEPVALVDCAGSVPTDINSDALSWSELVSAGEPRPDRWPQHEAGAPTFIPHGHGPASTVFCTDAIARAIEVLHDHYGCIVLDGPNLADCGALGACADGALLVVNADRTRREIVGGVLQANPIDPKKMLGAVLNEKPLYVPEWFYRRAL